MSPIKALPAEIESGTPLALVSHDRALGAVGVTAMSSAVHSTVPEPVRSCSAVTAPGAQTGAGARECAGPYSFFRMGEADLRKTTPFSWDFRGSVAAL